MNKEEPTNNQTNQPTLSEQLAKNNFMIPFMSKIKKILIKYRQFVLNHKKMFMGISGVILFFAISVILVNKFYDFTEIKWDEKYGNINATHIEPSTLDLNVIAYDKKGKKIKKITFTTTGGEITSEDSLVHWTLPNEEGEYTITASAPSGKKITKTVKVIELRENEDSLAGIIELPIDETTTDSDNDGLTDAKEKELKTDPYSADTDKDGLSDYYEISVSKTDPLKADSDNDGLNDGDELDLDLNPLNPDTKGDGLKDGDRNVQFKIENSKLGVTLDIEGKGNIASSTIDVFKNASFSNQEGLLDKVYNFYSTGEINSAVVKINYSIKELEEKGLSEDNLTLYYFNENTKELEAIPTTIDKEKKEITVTLEHFSKYVIGDKEHVLTNRASEILFVIDNSVSMYNTNQMIEAGYNSSVGAIGNDTSFKRLSLSSNLVDMFTGNYKFGVSEFSGNYVNLKKFSDNHEEVKETLNSMKGKWKSSANGTNIVSALENGIKEFNKPINNNYLMILTDGKNTSGSLSYSKKSIINDAKIRNVKICVIGLGSDIDTADLSEIASSTGCAYYHASDSKALDEIYSLVGASINYQYVDADNDNKTDGMIMENSGFIVNRDGFSFSNFRSDKSENGHCYGMALFAMLYYQNKLPLQLGAKDVSKFYLGELKNYKFSSNGYDLRNTYFSQNKKLYDFKITNDGLSYLLGDTPKDYRDRIENETWMIKKEYYDKMAQLGATFKEYNYKGNDRDFKKYQNAILTIDDSSLKSNATKNESEVLSAIWRLFILQAEEKRINFNSDPDDAWEELISDLSQGIPQIIGVDGHAINAIRLIQDINDANKFKIEVYDNNYPGETRYVHMERSKYNKIQLNYTAWVNEYNYTFAYDFDNDGTLEKTKLFIAKPPVE